MRFAAICGLVALAAAIVALVVDRPPAKARAFILVSPLSDKDPNYAGLPLLRSGSGDLPQILATALGIVDRSVVAQLVADRMGASSWPENRVASSVQATLQSSSDLIAITAAANSSAVAVRLASLYASAAIQLRRAEVAPALANGVRQAQIDVRALGSAVTPTAIAAGRRLMVLAALRAVGDPTLQLARGATPVAGRRLLTDIGVSVLALVGGTILGGIAHLTRAAGSLKLRRDDRASPSPHHVSVASAERL